jgi:hypothetical protein
VNCSGDSASAIRLTASGPIGAFRPMTSRSCIGGISNSDIFNDKVALLEYIRLALISKTCSLSRIVPYREGRHME